MDIGALAPADRHVEGVVEMVLDATANCNAPMSRERLFGWHAALFSGKNSALIDRPADPAHPRAGYIPFWA